MTTTIDTIKRPTPDLSRDRNAAPNVVEALSRVMADVRQVGKLGEYRDKKGTHYSFRGVDDVVNAVGPALRDHGVLVVPHHVEARYDKVQSSGGSAMRETTVTVDYRFYGPGGLGDFLPIQSVGESLDVSDKGTAKAMSVAYRIALLQALCLPTDARDPDDDHYERGNPAPTRDEAAVVDWIREFGQAIGYASVEDIRGPMWAQLKAKDVPGGLTPEEVTVLADLMKDRVAELEGTGRPAERLREVPLPDDEIPHDAEDGKIDNMPTDGSENR